MASIQGFSSILVVIACNCHTTEKGSEGIHHTVDDNDERLVESAKSSVEASADKDRTIFGSGIRLALNLLGSVGGESQFFSGRLHVAVGRALK